MKNMNVYLYKGTDRFKATENVDEDNHSVELNKYYTIDHVRGFLLIAYPVENRLTEFEFTYKLFAKDFEVNTLIFPEVDKN